MLGALCPQPCLLSSPQCRILHPTNSQRCPAGVAEVCVHPHSLSSCAQSRSAPIELHYLGCFACLQPERNAFPGYAYHMVTVALPYHPKDALIICAVNRILICKCKDMGCSRRWVGDCSVRFIMPERLQHGNMSVVPICAGHCLVMVIDEECKADKHQHTQNAYYDNNRTVDTSPITTTLPTLTSHWGFLHPVPMQARVARFRGTNSRMK